MSDPQSPKPPKPLLRAADRGPLPEASMSHPLNPASLIRGYSLSDATGMKRIGLHLLHVAPGKESFLYHSHQCEEEFVYILSGRGLAEIDGETYEVGPGDFMGFPTPSVAHHLKNPFDEDLVYLSGGERREVEIADFPRAGKRLVRLGMQMTVYPTESGEPLAYTAEAPPKKT